MTELETVRKFLEERKVDDVKVYEAASLTPFCDYYVIATAGNIRQLSAYSEELYDLLLEKGFSVRQKEGEGDSGWIIIDGGDVVIQLFTEEKRKLFALDALFEKIQENREKKDHPSK